MQMIVDQRNLFIDGEKRSSGTPSNFSALINYDDAFFYTESNEDFYEKIICTPLKYKVLNDFFNISSGGNLVNNQFAFIVSTIINPTAVDAVKIAIPSGYWTVYGLQDWLNENVATELNDTIGDIAGDLNHYTYTFYVAYNQDENKYEFTCTADNNFFNTYTLKLVFQDTTTVAANLEFSGTAEQFLGCIKTTQLGMNGTAIPSPATLNFLAYPEIFIYSNIVSTNRQNEPEGIQSSQVLLSLDNDAPKLSYLQYNNWNDTFSCEVNVNSEFQFRALGKDGKEVDFLSFPTILLNFKKMRYYRQGKTNEILENILKLQELKTLYEKFKSL